SLLKCNSGRSWRSKTATYMAVHKRRRGDGVDERLSRGMVDMLDVASSDSVGSYLENSGIRPYQKFTNGPLDFQGGRKSEAAGREKCRSLREKLEALASNELLCENPVQLTVEGTLFPCALLSTGWWEKKSPRAAKFRFAAKNDLQRWLFHGFRSWAPS